MAMQSGFIKRIRDIMRMDAGINGDAQRIVCHSGQVGGAAS